MADEIKYYFKETTNQVFVSGSSTTSGMNTLLTSPKNNPIVNGNTTAKISSLGANLTYLVQNGADDTTEITIADNQELWVYRGWQPANTEDANAYRYNPHLHRPYKAYMLTETGSGTSASPFLPTGFPLYSNVPFNTGNIFDIVDKYDERVLGSNGNISTQERVNSIVAFSGSFTVENENRGVQPYVFTRYGSLPTPPGSGATIEVKDSTQAVVATLVQTQTATGFPTVPVSSGNLTNGEYTFTSSIFNVPTPSAIGASQFGLYCEYDDFVEYEASNLSTTTVRVTYTSSDEFLTPVYFDLPQDKKVTYTALVGTPSFTPVANFTNTITNPSATSTGTVQNIFSTRVNDVYISYSSSLSESIDGLYIFNQIPQSDVQVTVSMFLTSWTGVESGFQYGDTNTTYSISPNEPHYGFDTDGGKPTFQTASILIYTGSYPSAVPTTLDDAYVTSAFSSSLIHEGLAVTMSTLIPKDSLSLKDCLSVALSVSSGSANSASVEQALVIQTYELEFNTPSAEETGDGKVPVFIENAFGGTDGFANAVDCQPLYNLIVTDDTLRRNPLIQEVEYNIPESFLLEVGQSLLSSQAPFNPLTTYTPFDSFIYNSSVSVTTVGQFYFNNNANQVSSTIVEINNAYYPEGVVDNSNTVLITNIFDIWANSTDKKIKFFAPNDPVDQNDYLQFDLSNNPTYSPHINGYGIYSIPITNGTTTVGVSPFNPTNLSSVEFISGKVMTDGANIIVSQVPLSNGTLQITTTGTGTDLELDITSIDSGAGLSIIVSSPGRGHKNGDLLTIPQSVLTPVFGNAIVRDLQITLSFTYGLYNPSNFKAIKNNTAIKSTVPESFYTQNSSIIPRYDGAKSSANFVNSIDGLVGGFGRVPVIDYKTAYFAYCDQVIDLYPVINNKTLFNVKYLINEGGDAKQPNLSPYTAFDIQGSWQADGVARIGVNQSSGSTQYDVLNNIQSVYEVTKLPSPYLYSQTGASTFSTWIPLGSDTYNVASNDDEFMNYSMGIAGAPYSEDNNEININLPNLVSGSNNRTMPTNYTVNYEARYGFSGSNPGGSVPTVYASSSIITASAAAPLPSIYALPGEVFFNQDQFAYDNDNTPARSSLQPKGNQLSDNYIINLDAEFPSTPPHYIRTSPFGDKTTRTNGKDEGQSVGSILIQLKSKDMSLGDVANQDYATDTGWNNEKLYDKDLEAIISINYGSNTNIEIDLKEVKYKGNKSVEFLTGNKGIQINVMPQSIHKILVDNYGSSKGISSKGESITKFNSTSALYAKFIIRLKTDITLIANRRYRWAVTQEYQPVGSNQGDKSPVNLWNPTTTGINYVNGSYELLNPPINGPFVKMTIEGKKTPSVPTDYDPFTDTKNFIAPFWEFKYPKPYDPDVTPIPFDMEPSASQTTLTLVSNVGNSSYGTGDIMGELNYTASANERFPGGLEPADSAFPFTGIPWSVIRPGDIFTPGGSSYDEIRFENNESFSYKILNYLTPKENSGKLQITLDGVAERSVNIDFFLLRRYVYSPNTILINREFPYGSLPVTKEFIPSTNVDLVNEANKTGDLATGSLSTSSQSGSIVTIYKPLTKADNTPSGIIFPEFPTELIDLNPDEVIINLRDKKLIE